MCSFNLMRSNLTNNLFHTDISLLSQPHPLPSSEFWVHCEANRRVLTFSLSFQWEGFSWCLLSNLICSKFASYKSTSSSLPNPLTTTPFCILWPFLLRVQAEISHSQSPQSQHRASSPLTAQQWDHLPSWNPNNMNENPVSFQ